MSVDNRTHSDQAVLITGAARGIGRALCEEALRRGYEVHSLVRKLEDAPVGTVPHAADIRDRVTLEKILVELAPRLTCFIANAGIDGRYHPESEAAAETCVDVFEVNGTATAFSMVVMAREWVKLKKRGTHLGVVSSLAAGRGMPMAGFYIATKMAELCLAQAMDGDLAPYGIGVSAIRPGFVETDMTAKNGWMPCLWKVDRAARFIWDGLERRRFMIAFPLPMRALCWVRDTMPWFVFRALNRAIGRRRVAANENQNRG